MKLSHYEWDPEKDLIGSGGFAEVFKAKDLNTANRFVALKIYKEAVSRGTTGNTGSMKYSLEQEFAKVDELSHTHIISYYGLDYIEHKDAMGRSVSYPVLIMEYAGDGTLKELLKNKVPVKTVERIITDILSATQYLHGQGIIHRDLKPGNILLKKDKHGNRLIKITDFGISQDKLGDKTLLETFTEGVGTPHYMSPEQFARKKYGLNEEISERTDIWAIGVILYRMLTGKMPFGDGTKDYELTRNEILEKDLDMSSVPDKFKTVLKKCLQREAKNRYRSAAEMLRAIREEDEEGTVFIPKGTSAEKLVEKKRKVWPLLIGTSVLLIGLVFGCFKWYEHKKVNDLLTEAWDFYKEGEFKNAHELYVKASEYNSGRAYYYLSLMHEIGRGTDRNYEKSRKYADLALAEDYDMAAFNYGDMYLSGLGVPIDTAEALKYYKRSIGHIKELSKEGDPEALHLQGLYYLDRNKEGLDTLKSYEFIKKAAEKEHPIAISNLASNSQYGTGMEKNCEEALQLFEQGSAINFDRSIHGLGNIYYWGCDGIERNYEKALSYYQKSAKLGYLLSEYRLGVIYHYGRGVPVDLDEALIWYAKAAEGDHVTSFNNLGLIYQEKENLLKAKEWFEKAANKNSIYGAYNLGSLYFDDKLKDVNSEKAMKWFQIAANGGHSGAQMRLGYVYNNKLGTPDRDKAFYWYKKSAEQGNSAGEYNLANMYENGMGCEKDLVIAKDWYLKSANHGFENAQYVIGTYYEDGVGGLSKDDNEAFKWYEKAANQKYDRAQFKMGEYYYEGIGNLSKDEKEARKWYLLAAEQGYAPAQALMGYLYQYGRGGSLNYTLAKDWYDKAVAQENAKAQSYLSNMYIQGHGVPEDYKMAFYWAEKGANNGNSYGQFVLGFLYKNGAGTFQSDRLAKKWLGESCKNEFAAACEMLKEIP